MTAKDTPIGLLVRILNKIKRIFSLSSVVAHSPVGYHERGPCLLQAVFPQKQSQSWHWATVQPL